MSILYEITGYQAESDNFEFWDNYGDFEDLTRRAKTEEEEIQTLTENSTGERLAA